MSENGFERQDGVSYSYRDTAAYQQQQDRPSPPQETPPDQSAQQLFQLPSERFAQERPPAGGPLAAPAPVVPPSSAPIQDAMNAQGGSEQHEHAHRWRHMLIILAISLVVIAIVIIIGTRRGPVDDYNDAMAQMRESFHEQDVGRCMDALMEAVRLRTEYSDEIEAAIDAGEAVDIYEVDAKEYLGIDKGEETAEDDEDR